MSEKELVEEALVQKLDEGITEVADTVDMFADLQYEIDQLKSQLKPREAEAKDLKEVLDAHIDETVGPAQTGTLKGNASKVEFGKRANRVEVVDKDKLIEIIGLDAFMKLAEVGITKIRALLSEEELEEVLHTERTGNRKLTASSLK